MINNAIAKVQDRQSSRQLNQRWLTMTLTMIVLCLCYFLPSFMVQSHESRPLYIKLVQQSNQDVRLSWRVPQSLAWDNQPSIIIPAVCTQKSTLKQGLEAGTYQIMLHCSELNKSTEFTIDYPKANPSISSLVEIKLNHAAKYTMLLGPQQTEWQLDTQQVADKGWLAYAELGVKHIWLGVDHLLFIGCLIFFARGWRKLVWTITGFTIAHSITLGLTSLQLVEVDIVPIEAIIALSILFLAVELTKPQGSTLTWRYPAIVATSFGLLHGFGFASVLADIGLPQNDKLISLLFFNLGIEVGQLLFIASLYGLYWLGRNSFSLKTNLTQALSLPALHKMISYLIGSLAAFWFWQRLALF